MNKAKRLLLLFFFSLFFFQCLFSQDKLLSLNDISTNHLLFPVYSQNLNFPQLQWRKNTTAYTFVKQNNLYQGSLKKEEEDIVLVNLEDLNIAIEQAELKPIKQFPNITWIDENSFIFKVKGQLFLYELNRKSIRLVNSCDAEGENIDIEKDKLSIAYTKENNLYASFNPSIDFKLTEDDNPEIVNGQEVHRSEFGISKGTFWSPNGNYLAFYRKDETMVTDYPIVNISGRVAEEQSVKYPMAGMKSHHVTLGIFDLQTKKIIYIKTGEPKDQYLTNIAWAYDEKSIFIAVLNRDQNHMKLNQYDIISGEIIRTLFEEKDEKYVEPENPMIFIKNKPEEFLWLSERDGFNHLYQYNINGELIGQLTKGSFNVISFLGFDGTGNNAFYTAIDEKHPLNQNIYSINLTDKKSKKLNSIDGIHKGTLNDDGSYIIDFYSNHIIPSQIDILSTQGELLKTIYKGENPFDEYHLGEISMSSLKADDGVDLYFRMIKPPDFDKKKKYPVIIYVYGGPHLQLVYNKFLWGARLWELYMSQRGYIIFTLDNHGSSNRGLEFEQATFRNLGEVEVRDQMKGIDYLKSLSYVDASRLGLYGWSFGGFMTLSLMLKQPETFKVGVAGGPVTNWKYYEIMYCERYMDTPDSNPSGYEKSNMMNYVQNLKGKLLIIHGTSDDTVVWQHSLKFIKECINKGVQLDYFVYPGHKHNIRGKDILHLNEKKSNYFLDNL